MQLFYLHPPSGSGVFPIQPLANKEEMENLQGGAHQSSLKTYITFQPLYSIPVTASRWVNAVKYVAQIKKKMDLM